MTNRDSTQSAPLAPPHYELLSHPLVHYPYSPSYIGCLDILHNAAHLLDLFQQLNLDETSDHGGMSTNAAEAFFWLANMLEDTLYYVGNTLEDAWKSRETQLKEQQLQQSVFVKALQEPTGNDKSYAYGIIASCLGISCADVEAFVTLTEEQQNSGSDVQEGRD
ncbi:hypothetical protein FKG94_13095 [Exilibacterium tricleocarpae]|uniref:Uncharacterized protein n=1 Tax=Exilibacterium tricleocarpae TaxID=2591008 RepID=A0A545TLC5_9GAMM|nr:hypothetical protein [Exilibacterium tricleocarpae]TQV78017.1 hypothetical protein FKG94_13095 [Exilibacterium tricleocarpae]